MLKRKLLMRGGRVVGINPEHARCVLANILRRSHAYGPDFGMLNEVEEMAIRYFLINGGVYVKDL